MANDLCTTFAKPVVSRDVFGVTGSHAKPSVFHPTGLKNFENFQPGGMKNGRIEFMRRKAVFLKKLTLILP